MNANNDPVNVLNRFKEIIQGKSNTAINIYYSLIYHPSLSLLTLSHPYIINIDYIERKHDTSLVLSGLLRAVKTSKNPEEAAREHGLLTIGSAFKVRWVSIKYTIYNSYILAKPKEPIIAR